MLKEVNFIKIKLRFIFGRVYLLNKDFGVGIVGFSYIKNDIVNIIKLYGDGWICYWFIKNIILIW